MDPGLVREGIPSDDRLVRLDGLAGQLGEKLARGEEHGRPIPVSKGSRSPRTRSAITNSSSDAFPARSPMPFTVHSIWRAPPSIAASEFATARPRSLWQWAERTTCSAPGTRGADRPEHRADLVRHRVADRVGEVHRRRPGLRRRPRRSSRGSPGRCASRPRPRTRRRPTKRARARDAGPAASSACSREMPSFRERWRSDVAMKTCIRGRAAPRAPAPARSMSAGRQRARRRDGRAANGLRDGADRLEVVRGRDREAGLDDVDAQLVELPREAELLVLAQREARGLLAVAQRRVEDGDAGLTSPPCPSQAT